MAQTPDLLRIDISGAVASLVLARPESLNALNRPLLAELLGAVEMLSKRNEVRVLRISGEGRAFCSGADLASGSVQPGQPGYDAGQVLEDYYNPLVKALWSLPMPVVCAVQGAAAGAGAVLALCADFVIAERSAYFVLAFTRAGLVPDAGCHWLLPRLVGRARAARMMMLGERVPAETAVQWGLIHEVVEDGTLGQAADELAATLAAGPTVAYHLIRTGLAACATLTLDESLALERSMQQRAGQTADFAEGVAAFREKRRPTFKGR